MLKYILTFLAGAILCGAVVFLVLHGRSSELDKQLDVTRAALDSAVASNTRLAAANTKLQHDLDDTVARATGAERTNAILRGQLADAARGLKQLADSITGGLGNLTERAEGIRKLVASLYLIYHPGAKVSPSP